jgi:hypothetical protein
MQMKTKMGAKSGKTISVVLVVFLFKEEKKRMREKTMRNSE